MTNEKIKDKFNKLFNENENPYTENPYITELILKNIKEKKINLLELGIGDGRMSIPLGRAGFKITGVDFSQVAIKKFITKAKNEKINHEAICSDILKYKFEENFQLIIASTSLQFLENKEKISEIIAKMKKHTVIDGYNYISIPTKTKIGINFPTLLENKEELYNYYRDWELIFIDEIERNFRKKISGTLAYIMAKKIPQE